jgi:hypothetical protein
VPGKKTKLTTRPAGGHVLVMNSPHLHTRSSPAAQIIFFFMCFVSHALSTKLVQFHFSLSIYTSTLLQAPRLFLALRAPPYCRSVEWEGWGRNSFAQPDS